MTKVEIQASVHEFVLNKFPAAKSAGLDLDAELLDRGIVDSMGILEIVLFIEERFKVVLDDEEMVPENFQTIPALAELVHRKLGVAAS